MHKAMLIDPSKCIGCRACQIACKDEYCGNDWMPYARAQPDTGQFWMKVNEYISGNYPQLRVSYVPQHCMHCETPMCIPACPVEGCIYQRDDGIVIIDPKKCTGCGLCVDACKYGSIYFNHNLRIAQKCIGCSHIIDRGWPIKEPRCVDTCGLDSLLYGEESELDLTDTTTLHPEYGTGPREHYKRLDIFETFIAGTVFDPATNEVEIGAACTLTGNDNNYTAVTDDFGDFWFDGLTAGTYSLTIESGGKIKTIDPINNENSVGLAYS